MPCTAEPETLNDRTFFWKPVHDLGGSGLCMGMDERQPAEDIAAMGAPASPDALKAIVARHQRARTRTLGVLLAVALVAGPVAGWAIGQSGGGGQQVATGSSPDRANPASAPNDNVAGPSSGAVGGDSPAISGTNAPKATHLFNRTTSDGIAIRAYRMDPPAPPEGATSTTTPSPKPEGGQCTMPGKPGPATGSATANANSGASASASASSGSSGSAEGGQGVVSSPPAPAPDGTPGTVISGVVPPCPGLPPICKATPSVLAELSSDAAVGQGFDPIDEKQPSDPLSHLSVGMFGVPESAPAVFVTVQTGPGVTTVRLRLPSGDTDQMAPIGGMAVLAHGSPTPPPTGTVVEALDGSGKVLASMDVNESGPKTAIACGYVGPNTVRQVPVPAAPPTTR
jgi:hypothetical protein